MKFTTYAEGYQMALTDLVAAMDEETTATNALGAALAWVIRNGDDVVRPRATSLVQRFLVGEES